MTTNQRKDSVRLLAQIERHLARSGKPATLIGRVVNGDTHMVQRLRDGGDVQTGTAQKVRNYLRENRTASYRRR